MTAQTTLPTWTIAHDIIRELREEGEGSRGMFYELYGSAITPALLPLADLFETAFAEHPELVEKTARAICWYPRQ